MADRFRRLYTLDNMIHTIKSPVVIEAGALLWDNKDKKEIVQLKIKNITPQRIVGVFVEIMPYNIAGEPLTKVHYEYLDKLAERDSTFGEQAPILLENDNARSFDVHVSKVVYDNGLVWESDDKEYTILAGTELGDAFSDENLFEFYKNKHGKASRFVPRKLTDLWICTCGAINMLTEETCHICKESLNELLSDIDENALLIEHHEEQYNLAICMMAKDMETEYDKAAEIFGTLENYKDSADLRKQCINEYAQKKEDRKYQEYKSKLEGDDIEEIKTALYYFESVSEQRNEAQDLIRKGQKKIESIEEQEKRDLDRLKRKKLIKICLIIAAFIGISVSVILNKIKKENARQEKYNLALEKEGIKDYESAANLFNDLGDYADSKSRYEFNKKNHDIVSTEDYTAFDNKELNEFMHSDIAFTPEQNKICVSIVINKDKSAYFKENTMESVYEWKESTILLFDDYAKKINNLSLLYPDIQNEVNIYFGDVNGDIVLEYENGFRKVVNFVPSKDIALEKVYEEIVNDVDDGKYIGAIDSWERIWGNKEDYFSDNYIESSELGEYFSPDYKDMKKYYFYAQAMRRYNETGSINKMCETLYFVQSLDGFKDATEIKKHINDVLDRVEGQFFHLREKIGNYSDIGYIIEISHNLKGIHCQIYYASIKNGKIDKGYLYYDDYVNLSISEDGTISDISAKSTLYNWRIQYKNGGLSVSETHTSERLESMNGNYTKLSQ